MGHERIGFLPKRKQWNAIVHQLSEYQPNDETVAKIAFNTLKCIRSNYEQMPFNESVSKAMRFLVTLSVSANQGSQSDFLKNNGCVVDDNISLFSLVNCAKDYISTAYGSLETNKIARDAILHTIITYQRKHTSDQLTLFGGKSESIWRGAGSGAAFCELARSFFAAFTDRQIKYYIERSPASEINDYAALQSFTKGISKTAESISHHAFETSKIMQSYAAGWFNKFAVTDIPTDSHITDFLRISFGKMREEFRREVAEK